MCCSNCKVSLQRHTLKNISTLRVLQHEKDPFPLLNAAEQFSGGGVFVIEVFIEKDFRCWEVLAVALRLLYSWNDDFFKSIINLLWKPNGILTIQNIPKHFAKPDKIATYTI